MRYGDHSLDELRRRGVRRVEFWCTGIQPNRRECTNRNVAEIGSLIERHGPGTTMVMLARRMRCRICGHRGGHVQPEAPPAQGTPGHAEWVRAEVDRCAAFLAEHGSDR